MTQTDASAREVPHGHGGGNFAAVENRTKETPRADDASKLHTVLRHPEEHSSGAASSGLREHGPEVVTLDGSHGIVHEDDVGAAHPESKVQQEQKKSKAMVSCYSEPGNPGCK